MVPYKTFVTLISGGITAQINTAVKLNTHEMRTMILQHQVAQQQPIQVKWGFLDQLAQRNLAYISQWLQFFHDFTL